MSVLVGRIAALRSQAAETGAKLAPADPLRDQLAGFADHADTLRKLVVATTEGGAITGEQRLREDTADVYGAIMATEAAPPPYAVARVGVLDRELADVERRFATLTGGELHNLNDKLKAKSLPPLTVPSAIADAGNLVDGGDGTAKALFQGLVGAHFYGSLSTAATRDR